MRIQLLHPGTNFLRFAKTKIKELFLQQWNAHLMGSNIDHPQSSKLTFYKLFKTNFTREPYLTEISNFHIRKQLTKFRCSDHKLEIEVGRHKNIDPKNRVCRFCKDAVETEEHFLRFCRNYSNLRTRYFRGATHL